MSKLRGTYLSRSIALAAVIGVAALAIFVLLLPMAAYVGSEVQETRALRASLQQLRLLSGNGEQFRRVLSQLQERDLDAQFFLRADRAATGAAEIEQLLKAVVSRRGGTIISTQALPEAIADEMRSVSVRVSVRGKLPEITTMLHDIESSSTALYVRNLSVRARNNAVPRPGQVRDWRDLDVQFELVGFLNNKGIS
jgi:Tfp pilus assembly protein PilO